MVYKISEKSKKMSAINKKNVAKKSIIIVRGQVVILKRDFCGIRLRMN